MELVMQCPACARELTSALACGVEIDVCEGGCGGIWFDAFEMSRVVRSEEGRQALLEIHRDPDLKVDLEGRRTCPRCEGVKMWRHPHKNAAAAIIDECPGCGGFWLDAGELELIRQSFDVEEKQKAYTQERLEALKAQSLAELNTEHRKRRHHNITQLQSFFDAWPE